MGKGDTSYSKLGSLQILRAIAAVSVAFYHLNYDHSNNLPSFGSFGVDIFFVLSGFVMAMVVERGEAPGAFLIARLTRIVPSYWIFTSVVAMAAVIRPAWFHSTSVTAITYVKSLLFIPFFSDVRGALPILGVGWTLNYEMYFYTMLAASLAIWRRYYGVVLVLLLGLVPVALACIDGAQALSGFYSRFLIVEFVLGMACYRVFRSGVLKRIPLAVAAIGASMCYLLMAWAEMAVPVGQGFPVVSRLMPALPAVAMVLLFARLDDAAMVTGSRLGRWAIQVGEASYAIYLTHIITQGVAIRVLYPRFAGLAVDSLTGMALVMAGTIAVGQLVYIWLDRPMHEILHTRFASKKA